MRKWIPTQGYKHSNLVHQYLQTDCHLSPDVYVQQRPMNIECQTLPRLQLGRSLAYAHPSVYLSWRLSVGPVSLFHLYPFRPSFTHKQVSQSRLTLAADSSQQLLWAIILSAPTTSPFCESLLKPLETLLPPLSLIHSVNSIRRHVGRQADRFQDGGSWAEALFPGTFTLREIYNYNSKLLNYSFNNVIYRIIRHVCQVVTLCYSE